MQFEAQTAAALLCRYFPRMNAIRSVRAMRIGEAMSPFRNSRLAPIRSIHLREIGLRKIGQPSEVSIFRASSTGICRRHSSTKAERREEIRRREGSALTKLGTAQDGLAVLFEMRLGRFRSVVHCVLVVSLGEVRVMRRRLVFACFVLLSGFLVVSCRAFVMICCLVMMLCCFLGHKSASA